ncbi:MAG TPA: HTTM domain-containing protein [Polyangiaceae bacterium]|nr:HTTM domain-containing protein [Polyangiaceae bacterium]
MTERLKRLKAAWAEPTDGAWLAALRFLLGATLSISMLRFIAYGWIDLLFVTPRFHFKYWGFGWVQALPASYMHALFYALAALAACLALGLWFRVSALLFALGFAYLQLIDVTTYLNHYYLATLLVVLLLLSPADRTWSLDAWRRPALAKQHVAKGWLYLFRFQVGVVYTFAGLAKAEPDWLIHAMPLRIWLGSKTDMPIVGRLFLLEDAALVMSWAGFLFDATIIWWLMWRRTRPFAYLALIVFHVLTRALFPIGMFPVIMVGSALVFFPPSWPRPLLAWIGRQAGRLFERDRLAPAPLAKSSLNGAARGRGRPLLTIAVAVYACLSVALPLRHWLYSGSVLWHEQGMRWSWRVMVREKNGLTTFHVRDPRTGATWQVPPRRYLTRLQEREMSGQPDLILQLAHQIRDDYQARLGHAVEVRAEALVSLNGRRSALLIDPNVDLATIQDSVSAASWITRSPRQAPPHIRPI